MSIVAIAIISYGSVLTAGALVVFGFWLYWKIDFTFNRHKRLIWGLRLKHRFQRELIKLQDEWINGLQKLLQKYNQENNK